MEQKYHFIYSKKIELPEFKSDSFKKEIKKIIPNIIFHEIQYENHPMYITKEITSNSCKNIIIVAGGDSTFHEAINGIQNFENNTFIIVPCGSGNDFARTINIPLNINLFKYLANIIKKNNVMVSDYLEINNKIRVINTFTIGMSAEILRLRNKMRHFSPKNRYKIASAVKGLFYKNFTFNYRCDNLQTKVITSPLFCCQNGKYIGGGMLTVPNAYPTNGLINIGVIKKPWRITIPILLYKCISNRIEKINKYEQFTCKNIAFDFQRDNIDVEIDGILHKLPRLTNVTVIPKKIRILLP